MTIDSQREQFTDSPSSQAERWAIEFAAAKEKLREWHRQAEDVDKQFRDEREKNDGDRRLNLFTADVNTIMAMLYGRTPKANCDRRFADSADDVARVGGEMLERLINTDIERDGDGYADAVGLALQDWRLGGLGNSRVRYVVEMGETEETPAIVGPDGVELAPAIPAQPVKVSEDVEVDYVYWRDQLWSPARVFSEIRWWAFRAYMTRDAVVDRFPEHGKKLPLAGKKDHSSDDAKNDDPLGRVEVWEIWDREHEEVVWYVDGYPEVLETKPDPLELSGFFPFPKPLIANTTTTAFVPRPDYVLRQDLDREINTLSTRIDNLESALKVAGVYDKNCGENLSKLVKAGDNQLIPVDSWAAFAEKGGLKGAIDWMPLEQIVGALDRLEVARERKIALLHQVTGMSDIIRGQAEGSATATEQGIKARFAGIRIKAWQDEFARFCGDLLKLKAEIVARHFDAKTIIERSNVLRTADAPMAEEAAELVKADIAGYRVEVKPENVSLEDYAALKQERMEVIGAIGQFVQGAVMPMMQAAPPLVPAMLKVMQWAIAGIKGASTIEGVLDRAIDEAEKAAQTPKPPPPDPRIQLEAEKLKQQREIEAGKAAADLARIDAQARADVEVKRAEAGIELDRAALEAEMAAALGGPVMPLPPQPVQMPMGVMP